MKLHKIRTDQRPKLALNAEGQVEFFRDEARAVGHVEAHLEKDEAVQVDLPQDVLSLVLSADVQAITAMGELNQVKLEKWCFKTIKFY